MIVKKRLGEMLIERKLLTEGQLKQALVEQRKAGLRLGQYLTRQGILNENQIVDMLSVQLKIKKYHPDRYPIDVGLDRLIPIETAQKFQVAPLMKKGRLLTIAMTDPLDINALDTIEIAANAEVEPVVCTEREVNQLINGIYGMQSGMGGVLESMEIEAQPEEEKAQDKLAEEVQIASLQDQADEVPVVRLVNSIFAQAIREGASDVHISPQQTSIQLRFRIDGKLHEVPSPPKALFLPIVARMKILANMDITVSRIPQDGRFTLRMEKHEINVRVSSMPTIYGENVVLRLLDMSSGVYSLDRLGMIESDRDKIETMCRKAYGMILSTGPTGSGKSTSLYSILDELNNIDTNIITLEDPVEYRIDNIRQVQLNQKAGMTFASGLRSILRQDPDIIMVGEIRDSETAAICIQAAQTGHRLLSTIHTNDAAGAITRFVDMGIEPFLVASALLVSFGQRLVRTVCPYCKEPYQPTEAALVEWGLDKAENPNFQKGKGCYQCMNTGYKGRTGIFEVLVNDEIVQEMILKRKSSQEITRVAVAEGKLRTLKDDAANKVLQGITTLEEAASAVMV
ncbi:MAG: general secretion pathway protein GspE [Syntrophobacterales bacterium CG_4_8_14_3_um_filter_58_8]|nr:MAG: general secretion pathway protein GspE [Syntrophaceae bacterium CG2_30_58_14]PIV07104.1 MAG: general secretion pathway protein GspE [Syntrophobacterales bacterium CG03_land_8_20_14_0_80_58_14]PJC71638.1 MAG: general secretion pathway protein GspE [Syntrophobacterales bacterium CG_4_8_14_3_um_filter_58_8]